MASFISEICSELKNSTRLIKYVLRDECKICGDCSYILEENNLTAEKIFEEIKKKFKNI